MTGDMFVATVAADGFVTRGAQRWAPLVTRRRAEPGQRWVFLITPDGLHPFREIDDVEMPPSELLQRLARCLETQTSATLTDLKAWSRQEASARVFLGAAIRACEVSPKQLLEHVSQLLHSSRAETAQAVVQWCTRDLEAAAIVRTALEAAAIENPDAPVILVRRLGATTFQLPPSFRQGMAVRVSPDGRRLSIAHRESDSPPPGPLVQFHGLDLFSPWLGTPYDILLRHDTLTNSFVGVLDPHPMQTPNEATSANAAASADSQPPPTQVHAAPPHVSSEHDGAGMAIHPQAGAPAQESA